MGKYQAYPEYKDSGVEWLQLVPALWAQSRMDDIADMQRVQITPRDLQSQLVIHYSIPSVQQFGIGQSEIGDSIDSNKFIVQTNDVLFSKLNPRKQTIVIVQEHEQLIVASTEFIVLRLKLADQRYLKYLFLSNELNEFICSQVESATRSHQRINPDVVSKLKFPLPPSIERDIIANFLDHETAKIDTLIEQQQQLIQLLKEKRQAVISHAVTKGLSSLNGGPNAPMKDSGVEWLGEVPAHWRIGKCGFYISILSGFAFPSSGFSDNENDIKLLRGINVGVSHLKWNETVYWKREPGDGLGIYEMKAGDLVIGMDRPLISEGIRVAKVTESDLPCLLLQRVASLKTGNELDSDYLFAFLSSEMFASYFSPDTTGVSVPHISPDQISNFVIAIPPIDEQREIAEYLHVEKSKFKSLIEEAEFANVLLQERRTALISAAVTGKIDVRNWQAPSN